MPDYGVQPQGFRPQTIAEIREEIEESLRDEFGRGFPLGDHTFAGHVVGILAERLGLLWEIEEVSYGAIDPDKASGDGLRALGALTGSFEQPQTSSLVVATLCGEDASVIPLGSIASTSAGKRFATAEIVTIAAVDAWAPSTTYAVGDRVANSSRCYECVTAGASDSSGGPTTTDETIVDNAAEWTYLGEGSAAVDVAMASVDLGEVIALSRDLATIETPVGGWNSCINLLDAVLGNEVQTDESFRLMREVELHRPGTGPFEAVRTALLALANVRSVSILANTSDVVDENDLPPHSCEALIRGGDDQEIWQALWDNVPLGVGTFGDESGTVIDSEGRTQTLRFSRPTEKLIHAKVTLQKNPRSYVGDGAVEEAVATWGNELGLGHDVFSSAVGAHAFVGGVMNVTEVLISVDPVDPPVASTTLVMGVRDLPVFDTSRVDVVSSDEEP